MKTTHLKQSRLRPAALLVAGSMLVPTLVGCGGGANSGANAPAVDDTRGGTVQPSAMKPTMSPGKKKMIALAGAAALYYLYKKNKNATAAGPTGKYYLSKSTGRVYYRDANKQAHWVTPPKAPIMIPEDQAQEYSQYKGYNGNMAAGRDLNGLGADEAPSGMSVPAPSY